MLPKKSFKKTFYEKIKMIAKGPFVVKSFVTIVSFDCDCMHPDDSLFGNYDASCDDLFNNLLMLTLITYPNIEKNNCVHLITINDVDEDDENLGFHPHDFNLIKLNNIRIKGW
jgi:hypothetical protein